MTVKLIYPNTYHPSVKLNFSTFSTYILRFYIGIEWKMYIYTQRETERETLWMIFIRILYLIFEFDLDLWYAIGIWGIFIFLRAYALASKHIINTMNVNVQIYHSTECFMRVIDDEKKTTKNNKLSLHTIILLRIVHNIQSVTKILSSCISGSFHKYYYDVLLQHLFCNKYFLIFYLMFAGLFSTLFPFDISISPLICSSIHFISSQWHTMFTVIISMTIIIIGALIVFKSLFGNRYFYKIKCSNILFFHFL